MEKFKSVSSVALIAGIFAFASGTEIVHTPMNPVASSTVITVSGSAGINVP